MDPSPSTDVAPCPRSLLSVDDVDPFAFYEALRGEGPVVWDDGMKGWLVLDYETCVAIETDEDRFANPYLGAPPLLVEIKGGRSNITLTHGKDHERLRRFHLKLFSPVALKSYQERQIRPILTYLIDRIAPRGAAELAFDIAEQVPPRVIANLFGMPWQDDALIARILHCHEEIMRWIGHHYAGQDLTARAMAASDELNAMLLPYIRAGRETPTDDLASRVWLEAPETFGPMAERDALGICRELFLGGSDTTVHGIANVLYLLLTRDDLRQTVLREPDSALNALVEEAMRLYGSVQYRFRVAQQDCVLGGAAVTQGQTLILLHAAANRDPARYACPAAPDLTRQPAADHLAFNRGPRTCVGAGLARMEMRDSVRMLLDRLPDLRLDPAQEPPRYRSLFMRSFRPLHVTFTPTPAG